MLEYFTFMFLSDQLIKQTNAFSQASKYCLFRSIKSVVIKSIEKGIFNRMVRKNIFPPKSIWINNQFKFGFFGHLNSRKVPNVWVGLTMPIRPDAGIKEFVARIRWLASAVIGGNLNSYFLTPKWQTRYVLLYSYKLGCFYAFANF